MRVNGEEFTDYYYRRNALGDVIAIYNTSYTRVIEYAYDAWGNCTTLVGATTAIGQINPIRYRGYYYDRETGLYFCNSRYYDPSWRRFISPDDTAYLDPEAVNGLNLYAYCNNDPVNYADPSGHSIIGAILLGAAIGAVVGFSSSIITQSLTGDGEINWWQVGLDTLIGGISGALGASTITATTSMVLGGVLGFAGSIGGTIISANGDLASIQWGEAILKATLMGIIGQGIHGCLALCD